MSKVFGVTYDEYKALLASFTKVYGQGKRNWQNTIFSDTPLYYELDDEAHQARYDSDSLYYHLMQDLIWDMGVDCEEADDGDYWYYDGDKDNPVTVYDAYQTLLRYKNKF